MDFNLIFIGYILIKSILFNIRGLKNLCLIVFYYSICNRKYSIKKYDYKKRKICGRIKNEIIEFYIVKLMFSFMYL